MYIGVDVGGTNIRIGLLDQSKKTKQLVRSVSIPVDPLYEPGVQKLIALIVQVQNGENVAGIGLNLPGILNGEQIETSNNLPGWEKKPIKEALMKALGVDVRVGHDVAAGALGEGLYGAGKDSNAFVYII